MDKVLVFGTSDGGSIPLEGAKTMLKQWTVYILECSDKSLYTGITLNVKERINKHNLGLGAKSIKGKLPVSLVYLELYNSHSEALIREAEIKGWKREEKLRLIAGR